MTQIFSIDQLLNPNIDTRNSTAERLRNGIDNKYPSILDLFDIDKDLSNIYHDLDSQKPEDIYSALWRYCSLFITNNETILTKPTPPNEIIDKFIELANSNPFECIRYEAANNLYIVFIYFPTTREYLLQNAFYVYLFNHLNRAISMNFTEAIKIDQSILEKLASIDAVKSVFNQILNWANSTEIEVDPLNLYPPLDPNTMTKPSPQLVLVSNIYVFRQFLKFNIIDAIDCCIDLANFLLELFIESAEKNNFGDFKLATLKYLATSVQYTHEYLQSSQYEFIHGVKTNFFQFILKSCFNEDIFSLSQCSACLEILKNAIPYCCDYLISEGLISTIHTIFSKKDDFESNVPISLFKDPKFCAIDLCTEIAKNNPDKIHLLISEPGYGLSEDFKHYSNSGSYPAKISFIKLALELIKSANNFEISDFLASISCINFFAEFLESNVEEFFIDILQSLLHLIILFKSNAISTSLGENLLDVFQNSTILGTINDFTTSNDLITEMSPDQIEEFHQNLVDVSTQILKEWSEIEKQEE